MTWSGVILLPISAIWKYDFVILIYLQNYVYIKFMLEDYVFTINPGAKKY